MEIRDDGKGFRATPRHSGGGKKGLGVLGMRERVRLVGGTFSIDTRSGQGTTVSVEIPFKRAMVVRQRDSPIITAMPTPTAVRNARFSVAKS